MYVDADDADEEVYIDVDSSGKSKWLFVVFREHVNGSFGSRNVWKLLWVKFLTASFEKQLIEQYKESYLMITVNLSPYNDCNGFIDGI